MLSDKNLSDKVSLVPRARGRIDSLIFKSIFRRGIFVENKEITRKEQRKSRETYCKMLQKKENGKPDKTSHFGRG
jgi:hypothetical protein